MVSTCASSIAGCCGKTYHGGQNTLHDGADNVEDISEQPNNDELDRQGIDIAALKVLENLGGEDDDYGKGLVSIVRWDGSAGCVPQQAMEMDLGACQNKQWHNFL